MSDLPKLLEVQSRDLFNWLEANWKGKRWFHKLLLRWRLTEAELKGFIAGAIDLPLKKAGIIAADTGIPLEKLAVDAEIGALIAAPVLKPRFGPAGGIPVGVRLTDQARNYYKPGDFNGEALHLRMMPETGFKVRNLYAGRNMVPTGLELTTPPEAHIRISGENVRDYDIFRGLLHVAYYHDSYPTQIMAGMRIAKLVIYEARPMRFEVANLRGGKP